MNAEMSNSQFLGTFITVSLLSTVGLAAETKVVFDIPSKVECVDVTPERFREVHPTMKVVEATFQISASFLEGNESSTSNFVYMIYSPEMRLRVTGFLPNTTLESSAAEDRIEVTDCNESSDANNGDLSVGYSVISLGASKGLTSKRSEFNRYQRVAPMNLVLASGTVNRGNGVFYKLRPSAKSSLEGAKEFKLLWTVPKSWRGDWCTIVCSARGNKKASNAAAACVEHAHVGVYMADDREASELADALTQVQLAHGGVLAKQLKAEAVESVETMNSISAHHSPKSQSGDWLFRTARSKYLMRQTPLDKARRSLIEIENRFSTLAAASDSTLELTLSDPAP